MFGVFPHGAGIYQNDVRLLGRLGLLGPACPQVVEHFVGVGQIHLATKGLQKYFLCHGLKRKGGPVKTAFSVGFS